jgi:hypothetical protein
MCMAVCVTKITVSSSDDWIYWHFGYNLYLNYIEYSAIADLHTFLLPLHTH